MILKIRTIQCEIPLLKFQTMIEISKKCISNNLRGAHGELTEFVLSVHKCPKMAATITKLHFCTEEVPVLMKGQKVSFIRYMDPLTKMLYHNYIIAACDPL